jgi:hypothetical protein
MLIQILLVTHIAVLGYWLGAELVINSTYRYVSWGQSLPFPERDRLMNHVLDVDQHVRYALVLQAGLGTVLAALYGYIPGRESVATIALIAMVLWLVIVEATHRLRRSPGGKSLSKIDLFIRYTAMVGLVLVGCSVFVGLLALPTWLAWKLVFFAGVIACGMGIRFWIVRFYQHWQVIAERGSSDDLETKIREVYVRATAVLGLLWAFIAGMVLLSVLA